MKTFTPTAAVAAATLRGLAEAILALDMNHPHSFEAAISIGAEIERTAVKVVEEADAARFNAVWGEPLVVLKQEADLHRALLTAARGVA